MIDLKSIDQPFLENICVQKSSETQTLEFKSQMYDSRDEKKREEFLKDICAFANTTGGDLICGIDADDDGNAKGISPLKEESVDALQRRLGQMLDTGVEPRLVGVQYHDVPIEDGYVFVIRVPQSFLGPHRYKTSNGAYRFVMRNERYNTEMSYDQVRSAFDRTSNLIEQVRSFIKQRLNSLGSGYTPLKMIDGPLCVTHVIPVANLARQTTVDVGGLYKTGWGQFLIPEYASHYGGTSRQVNLEGLLCYATSAGDYAYVTQVFRDGALETLHHGAVTLLPGDKDIPSIAGPHVGDFFRKSIIHHINTLKNNQITGPAVIQISLLRAEHYRFLLRSQSRTSTRKADRRDLILPEAWVENINDTGNLDLIIKPLLDMLWQAFGVPECDLYDHEGQWIIK